MAIRTVPRPSAADEIAGLLDSPEISELIAELDALRWTGRKGYGARALIGACLVKSVVRGPRLPSDRAAQGNGRGQEGCAQAAYLRARNLGLRGRGLQAQTDQVALPDQRL